MPDVPVSPTPFGRRGKDQSAQDPLDDMPNFSQIRKLTLDVLNMAAPTKQTLATQAIAKAVDEEFTTEGITTMAMVIAQAHQIKNLTVMVQNLSTLFQDHLESLAKREYSPAHQPK